MSSRRSAKLRPPPLSRGILAKLEPFRSKYAKTLAAIFAHPTSANIQWRDIEALFKALSAEVEEREGSRLAVILFGEVHVFHRPHPDPNTDKGAVASIRKWLESHGVTP